MRRHQHDVRRHLRFLGAPTPCDPSTTSRVVAARPARYGAAAMRDDADLLALRLQIDAANRELRDTMQKRARLVAEIARRKRALGLPLVDLAREEAMLDALLVEPGDGFTRQELAAALTQLFASYRQLCLRVGSGP